MIGSLLISQVLFTIDNYYKSVVKNFLCLISNKSLKLDAFQPEGTPVYKTLTPAILSVLDEPSMGSLSLQARRPSHLEEKNKPEEDESTQQIALSPTLRYAGCQKFAPASM